MAKKTPEGRLKDDVKAYLEEIGAFYFMPVQTMYGSKAVDFLVCYDGYFIVIETKIYPRKATQRQADFIQNVIEAGGYGVIAYDLEDVQRLIARLDRITESGIN